ncbi:hypothetical protein [Sporosarcina sp. BP05]|uniref:hypothetical protein n=1 Tax=Sporosarcina sp. BP05 TaxID=2758726 RepID=UPI001647BA94|nr:hypothetical protein [Sporosarcina sp. BP05]
MKKFILFSLLLFVAFPIFTETTEALTVKSIKITETTSVFDDYQKVAVFLKGASYTVVDESNLFYHTVIGNDQVMAQHIRMENVVWQRFTPYKKPE